MQTDAPGGQQVFVLLRLYCARVLARLLNLHRLRPDWLTIASMPGDFLLKLPSSPMPRHCAKPYEMECIYVLRAAAFIDVSLQSPSGPGEGETAVVHRITQLGHEELERMRRSSAS